MARMGKYFSLCLVIILAAPSLLSVKPSNEQSTSKPSAPKFSIQFPNNNTIQLVIENQEFTPSSSVNSIIYYYRLKDPYSKRCSIDKDYLLQSNSETTTITIPSDPNDPLFSLLVNRTISNNSTLIDFQVQAQTGYYAITQKPGPIPGGLIQSPSDYTSITFNESKASDWSTPITVDLSKMAVVTPTPTPNIPEFPITILLVTILAAVSLLLVLGKRKLTAINH